MYETVTILPQPSNANNLLTSEEQNLVHLITEILVKKTLQYEESHTLPTF